MNKFCCRVFKFDTIFPRKKMFGLYGQASGVRPEECWPDSETIRQYREYEKVFYDGKTFEEIVAEERQKNDDARKYRVDR